MENTTTDHLNQSTKGFQPLASLAHPLQTAVIAAIILVLCTCFPKLKYRAQLARPAVFSESTDGKEFLGASRDWYSEGYDKFRNTAYRILSSDGEDNVIVPKEFLPELKKLPDDVLSFPKAIDSGMEAHYTKLETNLNPTAHFIKSDLTPALPRLNAAICSEVDAAVRHYLPPCDDWTEVNINHKLIEIIARVSGRVFVGEDLAQNPEYLDICANYTVYMIEALRAIKAIRPWLRPILVRRLPEIKRLHDIRKRATNHLEPIVQERTESAKADPNWQPPEDMLQSIITRGPSQAIVTMDDIVEQQLVLIFAAIHTTSMTATNVLYSLATTPEYVEPLREEVRNAMADNNGIINSQALGQMVKLDSYMKEVNRTFPPGLTSFNRRVLKGITLSNGQYLPPGVLIEVPSCAIYQDPAYYPASETFDGFRSYKLRKAGSAMDNARNQFVTTNEINLAFGYGRHACPGRFFAANEIKMVLARMLLDFDIKNPGNSMQRHKQINLGRQNMPDPNKVLMFKRLEI